MERQQYDEFRNILHEMRAANDERLGQVDAESKEQYERMHKRMDELELKVQRPPMHSTKADLDPERAELKATFFLACRKGYGKLTEEQRRILRKAEPQPEIKNMLLGDDTTGGYFAPPEFVNDLIETILLISQIRQYATVRRTSREYIDIPKRGNRPKATWGNEQSSLGKTQLSYGKESIIANRLTALAIVNIQDLEDPEFDIENDIREQLGEEFERALGEKSVSGTGVPPYPEGLLTNSGIATDYSGDANLITGDGLVKMYHNLKSAYAMNARWFLNRQTLGGVRLLKDNTGRYLLQPGIAQGNPNTILDAPYVEFPDLPNVATGAYPILFGDMKKTYLIVDRIGISFQRLEELYAEQDAIGFKTRMRTGAGVVLTESMRKMQIHS